MKSFKLALFLLVSTLFISITSCEVAEADISPNVNKSKVADYTPDSDEDYDEDICRTDKDKDDDTN
jgi:hypothetical protein